MLAKRAEEILRSHDNIEVLYKNQPIWIERVNNQEETAYVRSLNDSNKMEVPVTDLVENKNITKH